MYDKSKVFLFLLILTCQKLSGQELWLNANTLRSTYNDYDSISVWTDQSGNNRNAVQSGTKRPILTYGGNGNASIFFYNTFLDVPYNSNLNPSSFSLILVTRASNVTGYKSLITSRDDSPSKGYILYTDNGVYDFWSGGGANSGDWHEFSSGITANGSNYELVSLKGSASGSNIVKSFYRNGTKVSSTPTHSYSPNTQRPFRIGAGASETVNGDFFFGGYISKILMYSSALNDTDLQKVESYLAVKHGISLSNNYLWL